jgi:glycyl-tRNA synthetase beta chain
MENANLVSVHNDVALFLQARLKEMLLKEGFSKVCIEAVFNTSNFDFTFDNDRVRILHPLLQSERFEMLKATFKRGFGLVKNHPKMDYNSELLAEVEKDIHTFLCDSEESVNKEDVSANFVLEHLLSLCPLINNFVSGVMVMSEDEKVRMNRLSLLKRATDRFYLLADFARF